MVTSLPIVTFRGRPHFVDFRLAEIRDAKTAVPVRFADMKGKKEFAGLINRLRDLKAANLESEYIPEIDGPLPQLSEDAIFA